MEALAREQGGFTEQERVDLEFALGKAWAMYNPHNNTWSAVNPPPTWATIGDSNSIILDIRAQQQPR